jgi:hypothetical protein
MATSHTTVSEKQGWITLVDLERFCASARAKGAGGLERVSGTIRWSGVLKEVSLEVHDPAVPAVGIVKGATKDDVR